MAETGVDEQQVEPPAPATPAERGPFGLPAGVGTLELVAIGLALLVPLLSFPVVDDPPWALRSALMLLLVGPGVVVLVDLARRGDRAAQAASAFLVWATISALASVHPVTAIVGEYGADRGVLVLAAYVACWAIGRRMHPDAQRVVIGAALVALVASAAFGAIQVGTGWQLGGLGVTDGRAAGFAASSVYFAGLMAGGLGLSGYLVSRVTTRRLPVALLLVVAFTMGANLSGSRIGLVAGAAVAVVPSVLANWRRIGLVLLAVVIGVAASRAIPQKQSVVQRFDESGSAGVRPRLEMWAAAAHAIGEKPVLGWGPGRFRAATSPRITQKYALTEGSEKIFFDAHNVVIEQATTVGLVGLALLGAFVVLAAWRARGPFAWLALGMALTWLLEPVSIAVAPVALLALGAAAPRLDLSWRPNRASRAAITGLALLGAVAAVLLLIGTFEMKQALANSSASDLANVERVLPEDPIFDDLHTQLAAQVARDHKTKANVAAALAAARHTTQVDPERAQWWSTLGLLELEFGSNTRAAADFKRALTRNPWSEVALRGQLVVSLRLHDRGTEASSRAKLCTLGSDFCTKH